MNIDFPDIIWARVSEPLSKVGTWSLYKEKRDSTGCVVPGVQQERIKYIRAGGQFDSGIKFGKSDNTGNCYCLFKDQGRSMYMKITQEQLNHLGLFYNGMDEAINIKILPPEPV